VKIWRKEVAGTYLEFLESGYGYIWKYFQKSEGLIEILWTVG
jgi:hypothetical protein